METSGIPTLLVVVGDGTSETTYYSDAPVRIVRVEPDLSIDQPSDVVAEIAVFDLASVRLPSSLMSRVQTALSGATSSEHLD